MQNQKQEKQQTLLETKAEAKTVVSSPIAPVALTQLEQSLDAVQILLF